MTRARHVTCTGDPADVRAGMIRDAHARLYRRLVERTGRLDGLHEMVLDCQRTCLEAHDEAEDAVPPRRRRAS